MSHYKLKSINLLKYLKIYSKTKKCFYSTRNLYKNENLVVCFDTGNIELQAGTLARLSESSAIGNHSNTNVLVSVVRKQAKTVSPFLPLTVNFIQKASAMGRIPSTFIRRDAGMSNYEILVSRMIDRSIRPLFPNGFSDETQITCNLLALGSQHADVVCINTVSYALHTSDIPWYGPIGCVRVGLDGEKYLINPPKKVLENSPLNLVVTVNSEGNIIMLEGWANNLNQNKFIDCLEFGVEEAKKVCDTIKTSIYTNEDKNKIIENEDKEIIEYINQSIRTLNEIQLHYIYTDVKHDKISRDESVSALRTRTMELLKSDTKLSSYNDQNSTRLINDCFTNIAKDVFRKVILEEEKRCDGRTLNQMRPISCKINILENLHGSAIFQRGQTQVLGTLTYDTPDSMYKNESTANMVSPSLTKFDKKFMLHYEFPQYAVNEIGRVGARVDRREIGHGALAEKALYPLIPVESNFTIRVLCEVLESNGSSSMASVCAGSLALIDAGVQLPELVSGVAMGLVTSKDEKGKIKEYKILTDLAGIEDFMGDTDFKIAGTKHGITAVQADVKINGLSVNIARQVIEKSQPARSEIIEIMRQAINEKKISNNKRLPIVKEYTISIQDRAKFIGIGGLNIKKIENVTGVKITFISDTTFSLFAPNMEAFNEADEFINEILNKQKEPELEYGGVYTAKIVDVVESGLFIQLYPTMKPALLPNSQIDAKKISHGNMSGFKVNQEIQVKYFGRDPATGAMRLSRKALFLTGFRQKNLLTEKTERIKVSSILGHNVINKNEDNTDNDDSVKN